MEGSITGNREASIGDVSVGENPAACMEGRVIELGEGSTTPGPQDSLSRASTWVGSKEGGEVEEGWGEGLELRVWNREAVSWAWRSSHVQVGEGEVLEGDSFSRARSIWVAEWVATGFGEGYRGIEVPNITLTSMP